jgi:fucose permease
MSDGRSVRVALIILVFAGFVSLGLPDGMNGVAWPAIRGTFHLPIDALGSLLVMFTIGYLVSSFSSGRLLSLMSVGSLLALSCLATAISLVGYAIAPTWSTMVSLGIIAGLGAGAIDAGLNTFAATEFSARMVNWLHAFYGVGAAIGPMLMTSVIAAEHRWQLGYAIVGTGQLALALCFIMTRRRWGSRSVESTDASATVERATSVATLKLPAVWLIIAVFFVYTGVEAAAGTWAFSLFTEARGLSIMTASLWVSIYWGGLTVGRLLSGILAAVVPADRMIGCCTIGVSLGALLLWSNVTTSISLFGLGLMGFASAPIFPTLIATTPQRLGKAHASNAVGFQIAAAVLGQSILPASIGLLAGGIGLEVIGAALLLSALLLVGLHLSLSIVGRRTAREQTASSSSATTTHFTPPVSFH